MAVACPDAMTNPHLDYVKPRTEPRLAHACPAFEPLLQTKARLKPYMLLAQDR